MEMNRLINVIFAGVIFNVILVGVILNGGSHGDDLNLLIKIPQGELVGVHKSSRDGKTYSAFMGIPYADKPEIFELAKPASRWDGIRNATKYGSKCPQFFLAGYDGDEDCLFVNVFTPDTKGNLPVAVYIHGGGFYNGESDEHGADYFMDEPVILVTMNYRLSALGFLSTGDDILPGNLGLKDQRLAMQWVQQNIGFFGGDPDRVTLFGESAGAASVSFHVLSPASEGLFRIAIQQSGTSLIYYCVANNPKKTAQGLAKKLGCPSTDSALMKQCLKSKTAKEIITNSRIRGRISTLEYVPTIEPPSSHAVITEDPELLYRTGRFNKNVPMLLSVMEKEGLFFNSSGIIRDPKALNELNERWLEMAPVYFGYDDVSQEMKDLTSKQIQEFYFGDKKISHDTFDNLTNLFSDRAFIYGVRQTALYHGKYAPVYPLVIAFDTDYPWSYIMPTHGYEKPLGMSHGDDLPYLFNYEALYPKFVANSKGERASKDLVKAWVTMATEGFPTYSPALNGWNSVSRGEIKMRNLKWLFVKDIGQAQVIQEPISERMRFWDNIDVN